MYNQIHQLLLKARDTTPDACRRYFKTDHGEYAEHEQFLGIKTPSLRRIAREFSELSFSEIQTLLESPYNEERLFALIVLKTQYEQSLPHTQADVYQFYLRNTQYVNNWNLVDNSAHHIVGAYLYDKPREKLLTLAQSNCLWERRIAIVATWYFIKKNDCEDTLSLTTRLISDKEDLIHKACGWMLREVGKKNQSTLLLFLNEYAAKMPRTMLRYAIEKLSSELCAEYLWSNKNVY